MSLEFVFALFCLTVIALAAIVHGRPEVVQQVVEAMAEVTDKVIDILKSD